MSTQTFQQRVDGIICPNCTYEINSRLQRADGILSAKTSYIKSEVTVEFDPDRITEQEIEAQLAKMGYPVGEGRFNLLSDALGLVCIAALYFLLTRLIGAVPMPMAEQGMSLWLIFLTGLLGGVHCIGMCGGIMLTQHNALAYNGGRMIGTVSGNQMKDAAINADSAKDYTNQTLKEMFESDDYYNPIFDSTTA